MYTGTVVLVTRTWVSFSFVIIEYSRFSPIWGRYFFLFVFGRNQKKSGEELSNDPVVSGHRDCVLLWAGHRRRAACSTHPISSRVDLTLAGASKFVQDTVNTGKLCTANRTAAASSSVGCEAPDSKTYHPYDTTEKLSCYAGQLHTRGICNYFCI
jgi:hypothetical protein